MSSIETYLNYILNKIFARDVRTAIVNAIRQCYDDVHNPTLNTEALQAALQAKIDAGQMAALTIGDRTITAAKLALGVIPTPDATLSQSGVPADAKKTGDEISALQADLNDKVDLPSNGYGSSGKVLRSTGTGTEWAAVGQPTDEQATGAVATWLAAHPEATTTVQDRAITASKLSNDLVIGRIDNYVSPMEFGAVGDGVTDDTAAFAAAEESEKGIIYVPKGVYKVSGITTEKSIIMDSEAWITTDTDKADVIVINGDNNRYALNLRLKNTYAHCGIYVYGDHNHFESIFIDGLNYDGVTLFPNNGVNVGLRVDGQHNTFDFIRMNDFVQDYAGNDSAPQGVTFGANASFNYVGDYSINNCRAGVVNAAAAGTVNRFGTISVSACNDNGVYCVGGGNTEIGTLLHNGTNECLAVITDGYTPSTPDDELTSVRVGTIISKGDYLFPVRIKNAGKIKIGSLFICGVINTIIFANSENVHSAGISIENVDFDGSTSFGFFLPESRGELEYLDLGRVRIKDDHKNSKLDISDTNNYYFLVSMAKQFRIGELDVEITDNENAYSSTNIRLQMLLKIGAADSLIGNIGLRYGIDSNGGQSGGSIDVLNAAQNGVTLTHGMFQYDQSANILRIYGDSRYKNGLYCRLQPQYGTWGTGTILLSDRPQTVAVGTIGFVCVDGGTPGTWKELKMFPFSGAVRYNNNKLQTYTGTWASGAWTDIS